ncbi:Neurexophilin [Branchiostoma belcheri]|nr:Neurexophilin [Branchiostoma belcheri]
MAVCDGKFCFVCAAFLTLTWVLVMYGVRVINVTSYNVHRQWIQNDTINFDWVTYANNTSVEIINPKPFYRVGDLLHIGIIARDKKGRRKLYGGDYFEAVLKNSEIYGSTAGRIQDHGNGAYTVTFVLGFAGTVTPNVQLVHGSNTRQTRAPAHNPDALTVRLKRLDPFVLESSEFDIPEAALSQYSQGRYGNQCKN